MTHGAYGSLTHKSWLAMMGRCMTSSDGSYARYGGRGITVCERWQTFVNFREDMGERPSTDHSIERVLVDGNYEPGNCRWATSVEQRRNKRNTVLEVHEPAQIRWMSKSGYTHREIASFFGINREIVSKVVRNERWHDPEYEYIPCRKLKVARGV